MCLKIGRRSRSILELVELASPRLGMRSGIPGTSASVGKITCIHGDGSASAVQTAGSRIPEEAPTLPVRAIMTRGGAADRKVSPREIYGNKVDMRRSFLYLADDCLAATRSRLQDERTSSSSVRPRRVLRRPVTRRRCHHCRWPIRDH